MSLALVVLIALMEGISQSLIGAVLPADFAAYTVGSLVVEASAFIGIMMLLSHVLKSPGALMGVGVGLWVLLDFFWGVLVLIGSSLLGIQIGSGDYLGLTIQSSFFNPAQFYSLVGEFFGGVSITSTGGGTPISPATYGVNALTLAGTAAFWILVPLVAFIYLSERRD